MKRYLLMLLFLLALFCGCSRNKVTGEVIYESKQCREFTVPYETDDYFPETEEYIEEVCEEETFDYLVKNVRIERQPTRIVIFYDVFNQDDRPFSFTGGVEWYEGIQNISKSQFSSYRVLPGQRVKVARVLYESGSEFSGKPVVLVPSRQICRNVTKQREVIKYGTVMKNKTKLLCWNSEEELQRLRSEFISED